MMNCADHFGVKLATIKPAYEPDEVPVRRERF
jgi:hypothetical protein